MIFAWYEGFKVLNPLCDADQWHRMYSVFESFKVAAGSYLESDPFFQPCSHSTRNPCTNLLVKMTRKTKPDFEIFLMFGPPNVWVYLSNIYLVLTDKF